MKIFKKSVGRPSRQTIIKRKIVCTVGIIILGVFGGLASYILFNTLFVGHIESKAKKAIISAKANKFVVQNIDNYCYKIYAPIKANYWKIQLSYNNKTYKKIDHYNDGKKTELVCFEQQKNQKEKHKFYLKWTKGANDKKQGITLLWKPNSWLANILTGWAYKTFNISWETKLINKDGKLIVEEPASPVFNKKTDVNIKISQTFMQQGYYSIIQEEKNGSSTKITDKVVCDSIKVDEIKTLIHKVQNNKKEYRYKIRLYSDNNCKNQLSEVSTKNYLYKSKTNNETSNIVISFDKNNSDSLSFNSITCTKANSCIISDIPQIYKKGYEVWGFSNSADGSATPILNKSVKSNTTLYARAYNNHRKEPLDVAITYYINGVAIDVERSEFLPYNVYNTYYKILRDNVYQNMPYLFDNKGKISMMSVPTFESIWGEYAGIAYGISEYRNKDISLDNAYKEYSLGTFVHELAHSWDAYFQMKTGQRISDNSDVIALFNKYKSLENKERPLRENSYTNVGEFVADSVRAYFYTNYRNNVSLSGNEINSEIIEVIEKYINIAKNNYLV